MGLGKHWRVGSAGPFDEVPQRDIVLEVPRAIGIGLPSSIGYEHGGSFVNSIDRSQKLLSLERETDAIAGAKVVLQSGRFAIGQEMVLGGAVAEESLGHAFETALSAAGVLPDEHFAKVQQFVLHDAAKSLAHVVAGDAANGCLLAVGPGLGEELSGDRNLKSPLAVFGVEAGRGTATGGGHPARDAKRERMLSRGDRFGDGRIEEMSIDRAVQKLEFRFGEPLEIWLPQVGCRFLQFAEHLVEAALAVRFRKAATGQDLDEFGGHGGQIMRFRGTLGLAWATLGEHGFPD